MQTKRLRGQEEWRTDCKIIANGNTEPPDTRSRVIRTRLQMGTYSPMQIDFRTKQKGDVLCTVT